MTHMTLDRKLYSPSLNQKSDALKSDALRALQELQDKRCAGKEWTGWYQWPRDRGFKLRDDIKSWQKSLDVKFDLIVVIGIGGSYLGAKAIADLSTHTYSHIRREPSALTPIVFAGHNMSESSLSDLLDLMAEHNPIVNVISKSGTTTEPGVAFRVIRSWMERRYGAEAQKRIIATTDAQKGALRRLAQENQYQTFEVPDDVGGRYSVFTAVGLVPLALAGFDIDAFLKGADEVFAACATTDSAVTRTVLEYAMCRTAAWQAGKVIEVITYPEPRMRNLVEWLKQLYGESDGKLGKGLFPVSLECTMDLHSLGQYMQDGVRSMIETFIMPENPRMRSTRISVPVTDNNIDDIQYLENKHIDDINATAMFATRIAHAEGGVPALELRIKDLSARTLGQWMTFYMISCAVGGLMLGINPFDQPGVEAYKKNLFALLGKPGFEERSKTLRAFS